MPRLFRYAEIAENIQQAIAAGEFERQKLPSERLLMSRYGVQRDTVRRALSVLRTEGKIVSSGERRSFVNEIPIGSSETAHRQTAEGTILVITRQNAASTALENLLRGLTTSLAESRLSVLYFDSRPRQGQIDNELPDDKFLVDNAIVGIVLWPQSPADVEALSRLRSRAPVVLVDRQVSGFETHSVVFDDLSGARALTNHLLRLGHRRIGFLGDEVFAETVQARWRGYAQALEAAGILADPTFFALFQGIDSSNYSDQMRIFVNGAGQRLTAVVCSNDTVALGFVRFLRRIGLRVPEDVAVTGFGNLLPNAMDAMRLTTVLQPFEEAGQAVGRILLAHAGIPNDQRNLASFEHVKVPVQIVIRGSSGVEGQEQASA